MSQQVILMLASGFSFRPRSCCLIILQYKRRRRTTEKAGVPEKTSKRGVQSTAFSYQFLPCFADPLRFLEKKVLEVHEGVTSAGVTSKVCGVVVVTVEEDVSSNNCGVVTVDDDLTFGGLRVVTVDEGVSSGVCELVHVLVTADDDVNPKVCRVVEVTVDEDITSGFLGVVP